MATSWVLLLVLGVAALFTTTVVFVLEVANARTPRNAPRIPTAASVAAVFEALVLAISVIFLAMSFRHSTYYGPKKIASAWFPASLVMVALATTASTVVLILLSQETENVDILGGPETSYLIGSAVTLTFAFAAQLAFIVVYFVGSRLSRAGQSSNACSEGTRGRFMSQVGVKAIPYSQTITGVLERKEDRSAEYQSPPGSSSGRSAAETMSSIRSSLSQKIRPINSKTRLLSNSSRTARRPASLESISIAEEGFDSWDTSSVDPQNRSFLDTASPAPRFTGALETIPASPTVSRSPSPGCALDMEAPKKKTARRSRSYSPLPKPPPAIVSYGSTGELHIHPLFRADSPTPPPAATPGTTIVAAPEAVRTVSIRSINRARSGSLPAPSSPLSRQGSYESFKRGTPSPTSSSLRAPSLVESPEERKMTPPLPEWVMNAGSRTSLAEYHARMQIRDRQTSGLGISQSR